jgi:hypothetical protein
MKAEKLGLITFAESEVEQIEEVSEKEAKEVWPLLLGAYRSSSKIETYKIRWVQRWEC